MSDPQSPPPPLQAVNMDAPGTPAPGTAVPNPAPTAPPSAGPPARGFWAQVRTFVGENRTTLLTLSAGAVGVLMGRAQANPQAAPPASPAPPTPGHGPHR